MYKPIISFYILTLISMPLHASNIANPKNKITSLEKQRNELKNKITNLEKAEYELKIANNELKEDFNDLKKESSLRERVLKEQIEKQKNKFKKDLKKQKKEVKEEIEKKYNKSIKESEKKDKEQVKTIKKLTKQIEELKEKNLVLQVDISDKDFEELKNDNIINPYKQNDLIEEFDGINVDKLVENNDEIKKLIIESEKEFNQYREKQNKTTVPLKATNYTLYTFDMAKRLKKLYKNVSLEFKKFENQLKELKKNLNEKTIKLKKFEQKLKLEKTEQLRLTKELALLSQKNVELQDLKKKNREFFNKNKLLNSQIASLNNKLKQKNNNQTDDFSSSKPFPLLVAIFSFLLGSIISIVGVNFLKKFKKKENEYQFQ